MVFLPPEPEQRPDLAVRQRAFYAMAQTPE